MSDIAIKIENVSKEYRLGAIGGTTLREEMHRFADKILHRTPTNAEYGKKFIALQNINLEVKKGERLGIIGHNGAGKSTLLKLLARVTAPTTGTISYNGRISSMLEVGTGFHAELTGRENIYMNGAILGMTKREIDSKIDQIIDFAEIEQFIDTPVKRYSSGMYVKLAFAVAAHLDSDIMIMDEVLAVGDLKFQQKCIGKMDDLSKGMGRTIIFVSHNMAAISRLCNVGLVMSHGQSAFLGNVNDAINLYISEGNNQVQDGVRLLDKQKKIQITKCWMCSPKGEHKNNFTTEEEIGIKIEITVNDKLLGGECILLILFDSKNNKVFVTKTFLKQLFKNDDKHTITVIYPKHRLSSGKYHWRFVIEIEDVVLFDEIDSVCHFDVVDTTSIFAGRKDGVHGPVFMDCTIDGQYQEM